MRNSKFDSSIIPGANNQSLPLAFQSCIQSPNSKTSKIQILVFSRSSIQSTSNNVHYCGMAGLIPARRVVRDNSCCSIAAWAHDPTGVLEWHVQSFPSPSPRFLPKSPPFLFAPLASPVAPSLHRLEYLVSSGSIVYHRVSSCLISFLSCTY